MSANRKNSAIEKNNYPLPTSSLTQIWIRLLELQTAVYFPLDWEELVLSPQWNDAFRVADAGCGPGDFLLRLHELFPRKKYLGIDSSPDYIALAKARLGGLSGIQFMEQDLYRHRGGLYDIVSLRMVLQHLPDYRALLGMLDVNLAPGGILYVMEANDALTHFAPEIPSLSRLAGGNRNAVDDLILATKGTAYSVESDEAKASVLESPEEKQIGAELYSLAGEVSVRKFGMELDLKKLQAEMSEWARSKTTQGQIGTRHLILRRGE